MNKFTIIKNIKLRLKILLSIYVIFPIVGFISPLFPNSLSYHNSNELFIIILLNWIEGAIITLIVGTLFFVIKKIILPHLKKTSLEY